MKESHNNNYSQLKQSVKAQILAFYSCKYTIPYCPANNKNNNIVVSYRQAWAHCALHDHWNVHKKFENNI